jgi:[acyl-carrier-protein] S-malonyltransferase
MSISVDPTTRTAIVFPGISQNPFHQVAKFLLINPVARRLTATANEVLGYSLVERYRTAERAWSEAERVAFLLTCLALGHSARDSQDIDMELCAGPSFGATPAAVFSGALSFPEAVRMTADWGRHIDDYFTGQHGDIVTQSFARTPEHELGEILRELDAAGEWYGIACRVDHDVTMLSLREPRLEWLLEQLRSRGGLPLYTMRPPMHSPLFQALRETVEREVFGGLRFTDPIIPLVSDHDGSLLHTADQVRTLLLDGIVRPVDWPGTLGALRRHGIGNLVISGPDGLWGRVDSAKNAFTVTTLTPQSALRPRPRVAVS